MERRRAVDRYLDLREECPSRADKYLSSSFRMNSHFSIALTDTATGCTQTAPQMLQSLVVVFGSRANNDFARDDQAAQSTLKQLLMFRSFGGAPGVLTRDQSSLPSDNVAIGRLKKGRAVAHGSFSALRGEKPNGRRLNRGLVNLGRHVVFTCIYWRSVF